MGAHGRDHDRQENHDARSDRGLGVARAIQQPQWMGGVLTQEHLESKHRHPRPAQGSEKKSRTHQAGTLVVVKGQFRSQR